MKKILIQFRKFFVAVFFNCLHGVFLVPTYSSESYERPAPGPMFLIGGISLLVWCLSMARFQQEWWLSMGTIIGNVASVLIMAKLAWDVCH